MLSRSAQNLYWIGRYLERARRLCSLLRLQSETLVDRPVREIHFGWNRIYASIERDPPGGRVELFGDEEFVLADSFVLADDLTFERSNPCSVLSCFAQARENARQQRHCISPEVWTCLNTACLNIQQQDLAEIWRVEPRSFYAAAESEINTFAGLAESTMYHDEGWNFLQLGRNIERAQCASALMLSQIDISNSSEEVYETDWISLLRAFHALEAYNRVYSAEVVPSQVLDLLVSDPLLPDSLSRSINLVSQEIEAVGQGPRRHSSRAVHRLTGRLSAIINYEWPDREDREALLREFDECGGDLHYLITAAYFEYPVQEPTSAPPRIR